MTYLYGVDGKLDGGFKSSKSLNKPLTLEVLLARKQNVCIHALAKKVAFNWLHAVKYYHLPSVRHENSCVKAIVFPQEARLC
jgi:hypothetical protein